MRRGLYISLQIILHGGTIEAEFPEDSGSRFVVSVPTVLAELRRQWKTGEIGE